MKLDLLNIQFEPIDSIHLKSIDFNNHEYEIIEQLEAEHPDLFILEDNVKTNNY